VTCAGHPSHWPTVVLCGLGWAVLAVASLAAPWFVVFAVMIWIAAPLAVLLAAGLAALVPARRAGAAAVVRGVGIVIALAIIPSALVVWGAVAQMGDNYF
jgi:hypothetical protein